MARLFLPMRWTDTELQQPVSKMAFGNGMGVKLEETIDKRELFAPAFGDLIAEVPAEKDLKNFLFLIHSLEK